MEKLTISANYLKTICWSNDAIIDWVSAGKLYPLDGKEKQLKYYYPFNFDSSIISSDGQYAFIYQKLGTKGLLLKEGVILREINRSYYCANAYEYPAVFVTIKDTTYLIHCPLECCRLDFEDVETGKLITDVSKRNPSDTFHSRLEINPGGTFLMSKGWLWHPLDIIEVFNIEECIKNPLLLDKSNLSPNVGTEVCTASFINSSKVIIGSSDEVVDDDIINLPPKHIAVWDILSNQITNSVKVNGEFGNLFAINEEIAWDAFNFPKIINIKSGEVIDKEESVYSGQQKSSIINNSDKLPLVAFNRQTNQLAIASDDKVHILTP
jgi:hypothetical protein